MNQINAKHLLKINGFINMRILAASDLYAAKVERWCTDLYGGGETDRSKEELRLDTLGSLN